MAEANDLECVYNFNNSKRNQFQTAYKIRLPMKLSRRSFIGGGAGLLISRQAKASRDGLNGYYEGLVATRCSVMTNKDAINKQVMSRKVQISTETLTSFRVTFSGFIAGFPDRNIGSASTIKASIEYPAGVFTQLTFGGSTSGTIPDFGILFSDYAKISIPNATPFWIRSFVTNPSGVPYNTALNTFYGEAAAFATSGLADQTMGGTITDSRLVRIYQPLAILAITNKPSAIVIGDSLCTGASADGTGNQNTAGTTAAGFDGRVGIICQSLSTSFPFLSLGIGSSNATNWLSNATARNLMIQKGSHLICQLGVNDLGVLSKTASQLISALQGIYALARPGQKIFQTTITPHCSASTDKWVTIGGQTPVNSVGHAAFNGALRSGTTGLPLNGYYDLASVVESSLDSDLWAVNGTAFYGTGDGIHPNNYNRFVKSGLIGPFT